MALLYKTTVHIQGGREGHAKSDDGILELDLAPAKALGGKGNATNPEQLFAAGYGACFESALRHVARKEKVAIGSTAVDCTVELHSNEDGSFHLGAALDVEVQGVEQRVAEELVNKAHYVCPYSLALRNNVDVKLNVKIK